MQDGAIELGLIMSDNFIVHFLMKKILCSILIFSSFCLFGEAGAAVTKTKFNPGPYLTTTPSGKLSGEEQHQHNLKMIKAYGDSDFRGFKLAYRWSDIESAKGDFSNLDWFGEALDLAGQYNKQVGFFIDVRSFGSGKCPAKEHPDYMEDEDMLYGGGPEGNKACLPKWWEERVMDRLILLYTEIGNRYDSHPNLEYITEGESTITISNSAKDSYHAQMKNLITEGKKAFPTTMIGILLNFYHDSDGLLRHMEETGGMAMGLPDTVPCRIPDTTEQAKYCNYGEYWYTIDNYEKMIEYSDRIGITPSAETWDLIWEETEEVYKMAIDYLKADHIFFTESFCSRTDKNINGCEDGYVEEELLPALKSVGTTMNEGCPSSFGVCVKANGETSGGGDIDDRGAGDKDIEDEDSDCQILYGSAPYVPPPGFGLAYAPYSAGKKLMMKASCTVKDGVTKFLISTKDIPGEQYIWEEAYVSKNSGDWEKILLSGESIENSKWLSGDGATEVAYSFDDADLIGEHYLASYVCSLVDEQWKCGCRDEACTEPYWQLQGVRKK